VKNSARTAPDIRDSLTGKPVISHTAALLLIAAFALPLYMLVLGTGNARDMMELFNLVPIREAYRDGHWLLPTLGGLPRMKKPPLPVWIPAGLGVLFHTDLLWVLRMPSAILGVLTCWATYAIGNLMSRDRLLGLFSAIALASMVVFIRQSRLASYDIYCTAFTTIGFWGLLHAIEQPKKWIAWAIFGGSALGLAVLSKGPVNPMYVLLPMGVWILLYHRNRGRAWLSVFIALLASIAVFAPWLFAVAARYHAQYGGNAWHVWAQQFTRYVAAPGKSYTQSDWYYFGILAWVFPWTVALIAGLAVPFLPANSDPAPDETEKRGRWLFWIILVLGLILLTIPHQKKQRYALQQFPFAALLIGVVWQEFVRLKREVKIDKPAAAMLAAQGILFIGTGAAFIIVAVMTAFSHRPPVWQDSHWTLMQALSLLKPALATLTLPGWCLLGIILIVSGTMIWRWEFNSKFIYAFGAFAVASWLLMLSVNWAYVTGKGYQVSQYRAPTREMMAMVGHHTIYTLTGDEIWLGVMYYANRVLPLEAPESLQKQHFAAQQPIYILTRDKGKFAQAVNAIAHSQHRHVRVVYRINDGHHVQTLFNLLPRDTAHPPLKRHPRQPHH
jgi:4-amino-4-deoxy-L-arabinose transferase-like glycosyltransferase